MFIRLSTGQFIPNPLPFSIHLYLSLCPEDMPSDWFYLGFIINLLSEAAASWITPLLLQQSSLLKSLLNSAISSMPCILTQSRLKQQIVIFESLSKGTTERENSLHPSLQSGQAKFI